MARTRTSRRTFLHRSLAGVAAAATVPHVLTAGSASAAAGGLAVAAIGVGGRGTGVARQAAELGTMVACCDVLRSNAERFATGMQKKGRPCKVYTDYRELLEKEKIDAVTIGTPDHWHVKIAIDAMKAGKHVYCEKPLTLTMEEGELVNQAVTKYGKVFQVGTQQRSEFGGCFIKAVAICRSGRLGQNLKATSSVGRAASRSADKNLPFGPFAAVPPPADLDWDLWLGQAPAVPFCTERIGWNFRWWFEYSGGQVTDWGVHHTDIAFWALAGKDGRAVAAEAKSFKPMGVELSKSRDFLLGKIPPAEMPVAYNTAFEFDVDVTLSTGNVIKIVSGPNELIIEGENGKLRVNRGGLSGQFVEQLDADPRAKKEIEELMVDIYGGPIPGGGLAHMQNFFDCVASGKPPVANVADHVRAVNACHMANIALLVGHKVNFDLAAGNFGGDAEATALMRRARRTPYDITG